VNQLTTYLSFNGNCREAMTFYQHCLGGELFVQTVGKSPDAADLPPNMLSYILEAVLWNETMVLMGTDLIDEPLCRGNSVSILLECNTIKEMEDYYEKLSKEGKQRHPILEGCSGGVYGMLTDRYGFHWLLRCRS
jgi:PhnB protein